MTANTRSQEHLLETPLPGSEPLLVAHRLRKLFRVRGTGRGKSYVHAVEDVSFEIQRAQIVALVGESGSGKSTTARMIARLIEPTDGEIRVKGVVDSGRRRASRAHRAEIQMIFQDPFSSLNPAKSVGHHLMRPLRLHHDLSKDERRRRIVELLRAVGLPSTEEFASKFPHELSGGQRQRVAFARALAVNPSVLLADEPVSMLDVSIRVGILNLIKQLAADQGIGFLFITHDIMSAEYVADETIVMYGGYGVEGGPTRDVLEHPAHPYTQLLVSAVPAPRTDAAASPHRRERGEPPNLIDPAPGCPLAARCPHVMERCRERMPDATILGGGHWVRCHLHSR